MQIRTTFIVILMTLLPFRVSAAGPDVSTEARRIYLKGIECLEKGGEPNLLKAMEYFNRSVAVDSSFAPGYAGLSRAYSSIGGTFNILAPDATWPKAEEAAQKAIALDDDLAEAHVALALVKEGKDWDWTGAEIEYERAVALDPQDIELILPYAYYLVLLGRDKEASAWAEKARRLDPDSPGIKGYETWVKAREGNAAEAISQTREQIASDPGNPYLYWRLAGIYARVGAHEKAVEQLKLQIPLMGDDVVDEVALLGYLYGRMQRRADALNMLEQLNEIAAQGRYVSPVLRAWVYAGLGDSDTALSWLEKGYETHAHRAGLDLKVMDYIFESMREDPRYVALLKKMNLEP